MNYTGIGELAYRMLLDFQTKRSHTAIDSDKSRRYLRALVFELRMTINLISHAERAQRRGDVAGRNALLLEIECPLLQAVAMGLNGDTLSPGCANAIIKGLSTLPTTADDDSISGEQAVAPGREIIDQMSLMVSRLMTVKALARCETPDRSINWGNRLAKLRTDAIEHLKALLDSMGRARERRSSCYRRAVQWFCRDRH